MHLIDKYATNASSFELLLKLNTNTNTLLVGVGISQGCPWSYLWYLGISRHSGGEDSGNLRKCNSVFCRWCGSSDFFTLWPPASTGAVHSQVWSSRDEGQRLWFWGHGSLLANGRLVGRSRAAAPSHRKEPADVVWHMIGIPPGCFLLGVFWAHPNERRPRGRIRTRWRDYISHLARECLRIPQEDKVKFYLNMWWTGTVR